MMLSPTYLIVMGLSLTWIAGELYLRVAHLSKKALPGSRPADASSIRIIEVTVWSEHKLVDTGPYRVLRHPSYTGALLAFVGLGVSFSNPLALAVFVVPMSAALAYRIAVEERALGQAFGAAWTEYCRQRARLVPFVW